MQNNSVENHQSSFLQSVAGLDLPRRLAIGLLASALVAYYMPHILVTLSGQGANGLGFTVEIPLVAGIYVLLNLIGLKVHRVLLVNCVVAAVYDIIWAVILLRSSPTNAFWQFWGFFFIPTAGAIINALLFQWYSNKVSLEPTAKSKN